MVKIKKLEQPAHLTTDVHSYWLLGYGQRQISDLLSCQRDSVDRALKETPSATLGHTLSVYTVRLDSAKQSVQDVKTRCSAVFDDIKRRWIHEYPDLRHEVGTIVKSLKVDCHHHDLFIVIRIVQMASYSGPARDLARMIASDALDRLRTAV